MAFELLRYFEQSFATAIHGVTRVGTLEDLARAGASLELDYGALNVFARTGMFLGTDTAFRDIRFATETPPLLTKPTTLSRHQVIDTYIDLFRAAVAKCAALTIGKTVTLGLSAGRDSRHILLELHRQRKLPDTTFTLDFPGESDGKHIAAMLSRMTGVARHEVIAPKTLRFLRHELYKNVCIGFVSVQLGGMVAGVDTVSQYGATYDGLGGDVLSAGLFLTAENHKLVSAGKTDEFIESIVGRSERAPLLRDSRLRRIDALERVAAEFRRHLKAPDPISSFYFWNRTRRDIAASPLRILRPGTQTVLLPYLDTDLYALLGSLTPDMTADHKLHDDVIATAFPEFNTVPYGRKNRLPRWVHCAEMVQALPYMLSHRSPVNKRRLVAQAVRSMLSGRYAAEAMWISRLGVLLTQAENARTALSSKTLSSQAQSTYRSGASRRPA